MVIFLNLLGALLLGLLVGYERSFHGRAAGMRTYGLVCMASARSQLSRDTNLEAEFVTSRRGGAFTFCGSWRHPT